MNPATPGGRSRGYSNPLNASNSPRMNSSGRPLLNVGGSRESMRTPSSIRIRRLPSNTSVPRPLSRGSDTAPEERDFADPGTVGRRRSTSAPQRPVLHEILNDDLTRQHTAEPFMPSIVEGQATSAQEARGLQPVQSRPDDVPRPLNNLQRSSTNNSDAGNAQALNSAGNAARQTRGLRRLRSGVLPPRQQELAADSEYDADVVSLLDLIDPEVQTLGTLTNMQNSLFVPDLGRLVNRRPTYDLTKRTGTANDPGYGVKNQDGTVSIPRRRAGTTSSRPEGDAKKSPVLPQTQATEDPLEESSNRRNSVSSQLTESHYAVLPHGVRLDGWSNEDLDELNDHVRHLLHSRREGFKRSMRGFGKYVSKPLGLFVTVYATLVTLFGAAWVFCLIGWIYVDGKQDYIIDIIDLTLVALFALMGDGLAPFRVVDTYHMCYIAKYHHKTWELREKQHLPALEDHNDLPARRSSAADRDLEAGATAADMAGRYEYTVLTPTQQRRLQYHQAKFAKTHTFYKPHETSTHHAFPLRLLVAIVVLLDFHSIFQVALGTCTWTIHYEVRPAALTAVILSFSLSCNIAAGILISIGDKRTRKKDVLDRIFRQDLTKEAIKRIQQKHEQEELGIDIVDEDTLSQFEGLELSRKSMEAKRAAEAKKPKKSLDLRRTKMGATDVLAGDADELDGRGLDEEKLGGVGLTSTEGKRVSIDKKGRASVDRRAGSDPAPDVGSSRRGGVPTVDE